MATPNTTAAAGRCVAKTARAMTRIAGLKPSSARRMRAHSYFLRARCSSISELVESIEPLESISQPTERAFATRGVGLFQGICRYYAINMPFIFARFGPFAALLAAMWTVQKMSKDQEITAAQVAGVSLHRLIAPVLVATSVLIVFQALLGMWTVTWKLKPVVVMAHLVGGLSTFCLLSYVALRLTLPARGGADTASLRRMTVIGIALVALQIALGGWTSANYAALACGTDFPTCAGRWWPAMDFREAFVLWRGIGVNYEGGVLDADARPVMSAHAVRAGQPLTLQWHDGVARARVEDGGADQEP